MTNSPNITIVMATYNGEQYIDEQLNSICEQTLKPKEIIIQDDASTDSTVQIINKYLNKLPIHLDINPHNLGYICNFELALSKASNEYICLCDQDDIWEYNKLESLAALIGENSLIYSNSLLVDSNGNTLNKTLSEKLKNHFISTYSPLSFVYDNCVSAHALMFHHSLLPQLFPFPKYLYFDSWIAANAASSNGIVYLDELLVRYRQHNKNTLSINYKEKKSLPNIISKKTQKKINEHSSRVNIINDLLAIPTLSNKDKEDLIQLRNGHLNFQKTWFNIPFFNLLLKRQYDLFAITNRNPFLLSLKKAMGLKLYTLLPFL